MILAERNKRTWLIISPAYKGDIRSPILHTRKRNWGVEANMPKATNLRDSRDRIWANQRMKRGNFWNRERKTTQYLKSSAPKNKFSRGLWYTLLRIKLLSPTPAKNSQKASQVWNYHFYTDRHMGRENNLHFLFQLKTLRMGWAWTPKLFNITDHASSQKYQKEKLGVI